MKLLEMKEKFARNLATNVAMGKAVASMCANPKRPLGKLNPWTWWPELVRGCNLHCVFCPTRLFEKGEFRYMEERTWRSLLEVINETTPYGRIGLASLGEPTLHPDFLKFASLSREVAPHVQLLTYTNGTTLVSGKITYKEMFDAGINCVFTDMYTSYEIHEKLAQESGYEWYHEDEKPEGITNVFEYKDDPNRHTIRLSESPYSWNKRKMGRGEFHTFLNQLDWPAAEKFGITPTTIAPQRRCDQPSKFVQVMVDGSFNVCCAAHPVLTERFGNINGGLESFLNFWLGEYMQDVRHKLDNKDRAAHELCSKCSYVTIRADIPIWKGGFEQYWDGAAWQALPGYEPSGSASGSLQSMRTQASSRSRIMKKAEEEAKFPLLRVLP